MKTNETAALKEQISELQKLLGDLSARLARLESGASPPSSALSAELPAEESPPAAPAAGEEISPETILVIGAAVTAFLGKKVRIRRARRIRPAAEYSPWAQQGRVFVQASHMLARHT